MADRHKAPSQSDQASQRSKAEGERDTELDETGRETTGREATGREATGREATGREATGREATERGAPEREAPGRDALRTGRGGLDPVEVRDVLDETSEKHRRGEDIGASGISNPTLAEEQEQQAELPPRKTRRAGGGT